MNRASWASSRSLWKRLATTPSMSCSADFRMNIAVGGGARLLIP
jgi:hypothetical protein